LAAATILAGALFSPGCSSDPVDSSTAALSVRYVPSPTFAGRYEQAALNINKIRFEPLDPELIPLMGAEAYAMQFGVFEMNLEATGPEQYSAIALPPGSYRIIEFRFRPPLLQDADASQGAATCIEKVGVLPSGPAQIGFPEEYVLDANDGYEFTVTSGKTNLDLIVDVPGLVAAYESAFTCVDSCGGGPACLTAFDPDAFRAAFLSLVTLQ
jgi:hypothetical protein